MFSGQLPDHSRRLEAPAGGVNRPSEDLFVEGSRTRDVQGWKLNVVDLAVCPHLAFLLIGTGAVVNSGLDCVELRLAPGPLRESSCLLVGRISRPLAPEPRQCHSMLCRVL